MKCIDLSMAILYILLLSSFLGRGFFYRNTERSSPTSIVKPLLSEVDSIDEVNDYALDMKVYA